jgi:GNAT superfamily N-acetyltransferase
VRNAIRVEAELPAQIARLVEIGRAEGFPFVERLVSEWERGENRFAKPGEVFLGSYVDDVLVGFGGLNRDPYSGDPDEGRVRHVYFEPAVRGLGLGGVLVRELVQRAAPAFVRLRLATRQAAAFYEHLGFRPVTGPNVTHVLDLRQPSADSVHR